MLIKYLGPSPAINVGVKGKVRVHVKDKALDYPDDVAEELLATARKQRFEAVGNQKTEDKDKKSEVGSQKSEGKKESGKRK